MSSSMTYSKLPLYDTHFISLDQVNLDREKKKEMEFNIEDIIFFTYFKTDRFMMKQTFVILAKFENNSLQYVYNLKKYIFTSVTGAPKPAVFSVNFTQFPHGIALIVRIMKVFSS